MPNSTGNDDWPECPMTPDAHPQDPQYGPTDPRAPHCRHAPNPSITDALSTPTKPSTPATGVCQNQNADCKTYRFGSTFTAGTNYSATYSTMMTPNPGTIGTNPNNFVDASVMTFNNGAWDQVGWIIGQCSNGNSPTLFTQYTDASGPHTNCYGDPNHVLVAGQSYTYATLYYDTTCSVQNWLYYNGAWQVVDSHVSNLCSRGDGEVFLEFFKYDGNTTSGGPGWPSVNGAVTFRNNQLAYTYNSAYIPWDSSVATYYNNSADTLNYGQSFQSYWNYWTETPGVSPDYGLSVGSTSLAPMVGGSASTTLTLSPNSAFESNEMGNVFVGVPLSSLPNGDGYSLSDCSSCYLQENVPRSQTLTISVASPQAFTAPVSACTLSTNICHTVNISVNPVSPNFSISVGQPTGLVLGSVLPGTSGTANVSIYGSGSSGTVCLTATAGSAGTASVSPSCVNVVSGSYSSATLTVTTGLTQLSNYTVAVTGTGYGALAGVTRTAYATVHPLPLL